MKTVEERAKAASEDYNDDGYSAGLYMSYKVGATEQKLLILIRLVISYANVHVHIK